MAKAHISTLPLELREEIWKLALLPDPGVYRFDQSDFGSMGDVPFEDLMWPVPKRKYPTAMHLCQEPRRLALRIMEREQQRDGTPARFFLGQTTRPFNPDTDTFWFNNPCRLNHAWVLSHKGVIGSRVHTIKNLAISERCISVAPKNKKGGYIRTSLWDRFRWRILHRFVSLRRVDIIFGTEPVRKKLHYDASSVVEDGDADDVDVEDGDGRGPHLDLFDVPDVRLQQWTDCKLSSSKKRKKLSKTTRKKVASTLEKARADVRKSFQYNSELRTEEGEQAAQLLPEGSPGCQDGSQITFHAARMVNVATFRARPVRHFRVLFA